MPTREVSGFAYRLRQVRTEKALTQADLAAIVGVREGDVSRWERGKNLPQAKVLTDLASALGVSLDYLFGVGS